MKKVVLSKTQEILVTKITRGSTSPQSLVLRARIILAGFAKTNQTEIAKSMDINRETVYRWLVRWHNATKELNHLEAQYVSRKLSQDLYQRSIGDILADAPRPGAPATFTEEEKKKIVALAAEEPEKANVPITHWTHKELARAAIATGIVQKISSSRVGIFLKESHITTA